MNTFFQTINLSFSNSEYYIEEIIVPVSKNKIDFFVETGCCAIIDGILYRGSNSKYSIGVDSLKDKKFFKAYLYKDLFLDLIEIGVFAGKFKFYENSMFLDLPVVLYFNIELINLERLVKSIKKTVTKEELKTEIENRYKNILVGTSSNVVANYTSEGITKDELIAKKNEIFKEIKQSLRIMLSTAGLSIYSLNLIKVNITPEILEQTISNPVCSNCGKINMIDEAQYCAYCGCKLK